MRQYIVTRSAWLMLMLTLAAVTATATPPALADAGASITQAPAAPIDPAPESVPADAPPAAPTEQPAPGPAPQMSETASLDTDPAPAGGTAASDASITPNTAADPAPAVLTDTSVAGGENGPSGGVAPDSADTATGTDTELTDVSTGTTDSEPVIPPNTDALAAGPTGPITLPLGGEQALVFAYAVTTPRSGTRIHAELRTADGSPASGWSLSARAGGGAWAGGDAAVDVTESGTLAPDTSFALSISITAPTEVSAEQTVSLFVSSIASTDRGDETGIVASGPLATLTVVPPPPPLASNSLSCDIPETSEIAPEGTAELACSYTVNDPAAAASVTATFGTTPGDGWTLAIGDDPPGATATWAPAEPLADGATIDLIVRATAATGAEAGQQATVTVDAGDPDQAVTWLLTVAIPADDADGGFSVMSVDPAGGICTQKSPDGDILPPGSVAKFACGSGGLNASEWYEVRISAPSEGWYYRVNSEPPTVNPSTYTPQQLLTDMNGTFTIEVRMLSYPTNTSVGSLTVDYYGRICLYPTVCHNEIRRSATLSITWPAPDVTCDPISPSGAVVRPSEYATFKCTHSNPGFQLWTTSDDARWLWAVSTGEAPAMPSRWSVGTDVSDWTTEPIFLYLKPNPGFLPPLGSPQDLWVEFRQQESRFVTRETLTVTYNAIPCAPAVNAFGASFDTSTWDGDGYTPVTATFGVALLKGSGPDCGGFTDDWSVQISSEGLTDGGDGRIAPSDISYIFTAGVPSAGLTVVTTNQPLAATGSGTTKIADGNSSVSPGALWNFTLRLQPPSDTPPGTYSGTFTVTIAGGD